jgi:hypothetical protein
MQDFTRVKNDYSQNTSYSNKDLYVTLDTVTFGVSGSADVHSSLQRLDSEVSSAQSVKPVVKKLAQIMAWLNATYKLLRIVSIAITGISFVHRKIAPYIPTGIHKLWVHSI